MTRAHDTKRRVERKKPEQPMSEQLQEQIRELAYELYCRNGCKHGYDLDHWLEAERRVFGHHQGDSGGIS